MHVVLFSVYFDILADVPKFYPTFEKHCLNVLLRFVEPECLEIAIGAAANSNIKQSMLLQQEQHRSKIKLLEYWNAQLEQQQGVFSATFTCFMNKDYNLLSRFGV